jgi:signal transduction histidine kinase
MIRRNDTFYSGISTEIGKVLSGLKRCRLCWRITGAVFFAILSIEGAILFFSIQNFERDRLFELEREAQVIARVIIHEASLQNNISTAISIVGPRLRQNTVLLGAQVFDLKGNFIGEFGQLPKTELPLKNVPKKTVRIRLLDSAKMDFIWPPQHTKSRFVIAARIDTSEISGKVSSFIWRIIGLVMLITSVVTLVTMLILERLVLRPIRLLNSAFLEFSKNPHQPIQGPSFISGTDELHQVTEEFGKMAIQLQESFADLKLASDAAKEANCAKSTFLSSMSHELRTPLNSILGFSQLMIENKTEKLSEKQLSWAQYIVTSGQHLLTLINEILDLSKIESGKVELSIEEVAPWNIINDFIANISSEASRRKIKIIPLQSDPFLTAVYADKTRFRQVVLNLLSNAIKYNRDAGKVVIDAEQLNNTMLRIKFTDTGCGMKTSSQSEVFEPFSRLGQEASQIEGTGIGLAISKKLIEQMNGAMDFKSKPGQGSEFWIDVPTGCEPSHKFESFESSGTNFTKVNNM